MLVGGGLAVGGLALGASALLWGWSDRLLARIYESWRPTLERQVGRVMGRPLQLGPYRGIGPEGLRIGPSRLLPGRQDGSSAAAKSLAVLVDPLGSWHSRSLILDLAFRGAEADLRPNARGQVWVLGSLPPGGEPPRLDLRFRLVQPGQVRLWGVGRGPGPMSFGASGRARLRTHLRQLDLQARATVPGQGGEALLEGEGNWRQRRWRVGITPRRFPLEPFRRFVPLDGQLDGQADGRFDLKLEKGVPGCRGRASLAAVRWSQLGWNTSVAADRMLLECRQQTFSLALSDWRFGSWRGQVAGRVAGDRQLALRLRAMPPAALAFGAEPLEGSLQGRWLRGAVREVRLEGRRGQSLLRASGDLGRELALSGDWRLDPADLPRSAKLPSWLLDQPLQGRWRADGRLSNPRLQLDSALQASHPLLGPWQARVQWADGVLELQRFDSATLQAAAQLPASIRRGQGLVLGDLSAQLQLSDYPLPRLDPLLGTRLQGRLSASGSLRGPLNALVPDLALTVRQPAAGPLRLEEIWQGRLLGGTGGGTAGSTAVGARLLLEAMAPAPSGRLVAQLGRYWLPSAIDLERAGGHLHLLGNPRRYGWQARRFPLRGLSVALGRNRPYQPLEGWLSGSGTLGLQPLAFDGRLSLERPQFLGLGGRALRGTVRYDARRYAIEGTVEPLTSGSIDARLDGTWAGPFAARFQARDLSSLLFQQLREAWAVWRGAPLARRGKADDLGAVAIETLGASIQDQLVVLEAVQQRLEAWDQEWRGASRAERLARLQLRLDADLGVRGPDLRRARVDLQAQGHLWVAQRDHDLALAHDPFSLRLEGALFGGSGSFDLSGISLALLTLLAPVPPSLRGQLTVQGRYRLGGAKPELVMNLGLEDARLGRESLQLERGLVDLQDRALVLDLAMRAAGASSSIDLAGSIPLHLSGSGLELRLASRADGLRFLTELTGQALRWNKGSVDLQLLVRGSVADPIANGFLRFRDGEYEFIGQKLRDVEATVLFDFEQLLVQDLRARVGRRGRISGEGRLGLTRPLSSSPTLALTLQEVPFAQQRIAAVGDGRLTLAGSLIAPRLGGQVAISQGTINAQPGQLARVENGQQPSSAQTVKPTSLNELLERRWDFRQPLVLLGPDVESTTSAALEQTIPKVPWFRFDDLRLSFGPDLQVVLPNVASFSTGGSLRINGRLDPSLRAQGVVKLLKGRLNLFTTSFSLDPDAPNVAVFTPSLGLVPFLDIAMRTRIADSLDVIAPSGLGPSGVASAGNPSLTEVEAQGGFSSLNQLNLILVTVSVSGPADRIAENIRLSSSPPLPQERLVALIGGNSLAGLSGDSAGTALATVLGQTLLSPLLSSFSDAFGQRVSLAFYPTYVNQSITTRRELRSGRVPPQLVLAAEVGVDLTDRLNASVLAAPNRSDVPPQVTLNYKASETFNVEASVDSQGAWQTLLQVFFRF